MSVTTTTQGPVFIPPFEGKVGGVDFLGLRQVNLDMMNEIFPGISNSTLHIRAFSVLSWIFWAFEKAAHDAQRGRVTSKEFRVFLEKAEVLFTWGHKLAGISVPGANSKCPADSGPVPLAFHEWNRRASNTSLNCALQYGPAMKSRGFAFAEVVRPGIYNVTDRGEALAREFDKRVQRSEARGLLTAFEFRHGRQRDAEELLGVWQIDRPSAAERRIFSDALFDANAIGEKTRMGERSTAIKAVVEVVGQSGGRLTEAGVRHGLARMRTPSGARITLSPAMEAVALRWLVLQIRQAQRAALEAYLTWFEGQVIISSKSLAELEQTARRDLENHSDSDGGQRTCGLCLDALNRRDESLEDYHRACARGAERCFFKMTEGLLEAAKVAPGGILPSIASLLLRTVHLTRCLLSDDRVRRLLRHGGASRISLSHQEEHFRRFENCTLAEWMLDILQRWVISQHLSVATFRFSGQKQRLRFGLCEDGFEFYAAKLSQPNLSRDHLHAALSLISESGLLHQDGENYCSA